MRFAPRRLLAPPLTLCLVGAALAAWPEKPVRVVVPFAPGDSTDAIARGFHQAIEVNGLMDEPMVVVNKGGAGTTIGTREVLESEPDGDT